MQNSSTALRVKNADIPGSCSLTSVRIKAEGLHLILPPAAAPVDGEAHCKTSRFELFDLFTLERASVKNLGLKILPICIPDASQNGNSLIKTANRVSSAP